MYKTHRMDCYITRDKVQDKTIHLMPISSNQQVADIFTKPPHLGPFSNLVTKLGLLNIRSSLRGSVKIDYFIFY